MSIPETSPAPQSALNRAASNGFIMGLYISVLVVATGLSMRSSAASMLVMFGSLAMPVVLYMMLRRSSQSSGHLLSFPELWAEGIGIFFFGTLVPAAVCYCGLRFVYPTLMSDAVAIARDTFMQVGTPEAEAWVGTLDKAVAANGLPTALDVTTQLISLNIIAGTVFSLGAALLIIATRRKPRQTA